MKKLALVFAIFVLTISSGVFAAGGQYANTQNGPSQYQQPVTYPATTKFTMTGCSASATTGGSTAGTFTSGTTGTCAPVITLPSAPTGWTCRFTDRTTAVDANSVTETTSTATTNTASGTTVTGDVISFSCAPY